MIYLVLSAAVPLQREEDGRAVVVIRGLGKNVSGQERLMDLGSSSGNTYALLEV